MIRKNFYFIYCLIILFSRIIDLTTTYIAADNFRFQEQNILVKIFNLSFIEFCIVDLLIAFFLILNYLYSVHELNRFIIISKSFCSYIKLFLYMKENITKLNFLFLMSFKRVLILYGSITPLYIFFTSIIFSLNNIWVFYYMKDNNAAVRAYNFMDQYYFFNFIIFILPVIILIFLSYKKLREEYSRYNLQ